MLLDVNSQKITLHEPISAVPKPKKKEKQLSQAEQVSKVV
jgi:hypothetical protein